MFDTYIHGEHDMIIPMDEKQYTLTNIVLVRRANKNTAKMVGVWKKVSPFKRASVESSRIYNHWVV